MKPLLADYNGFFFGALVGLPLMALGLVLVLIGAFMACGKPSEKRMKEAKYFAWAGVGVIGFAIIIAVLGKLYGP